MGGIMTVSGAWMRQIVEAIPDFRVMFLGTIVAAIGQVFFVNTNSKLASVWFGDKEVKDFEL